MAIALAPMEGVVDATVRDMMTRVAGFDYCVSEFVRVSQGVLPADVFLKICPELAGDGHTPSGVPVHVQLMGGEASVLAENAAYVCETFPVPVLDLNYGCPAKTVNRHMAGAALLQWPEKLHELTSAVVKSVQGRVKVSAKMRLGYKDKSLALENAHALVSAGISHLTVHARTKEEGYKAPAHWEWLARIREEVPVPVVANGEVWTPEDAKTCLEISGCADLMIGRGAMARPTLAHEIKGGAYGDWAYIAKWLVVFGEECHKQDRPRWAQGRMKQWVKLVGRTYPQALELFEEIKRLREPEEILQQLHKAQRACEKENRHVA